MLEQRYPSAREMLAHLESLAIGDPRPSAPETPRPVIPPTRVPGEPEPPQPIAAVPEPPPPVIPPTRGRSGPVTAPMSAVPEAVAPVVPPAPERGAPRRGAGLRWVGLAALGTLALGGAIAAVLATGVVELSFPGARSSAPARASSSAGASSSASAPALYWLASRPELEVAEIDANGDGVIDFVGLCTDEARARASLCAVDGATFQSLWRRPLAFDLMTELHLGAAGRTVGFVDPRGIARLYDAATGEGQGTVSLGSRAERVCGVPELPGKLWIRLRGRPPVALDVATRVATPTPRPPSCARSPREERCNMFNFDAETCPVEPGEPRSPEVSVFNAWAEGPNGVAIGSRRTDQTVPMVLGFTPHPREGAEPRIRWIRPLAPDNGLGAAHIVNFLALQAGRAVTHYDHTSGRAHVLAIDAASGRTLWEAPTTTIVFMHVTASRVYVQHNQWLDVRDAATGRPAGKRWGRGEKARTVEVPGRLENGRRRYFCPAIVPKGSPRSKSLQPCHHVPPGVVRPAMTCSARLVRQAVDEVGLGAQARACCPLPPAVELAEPCSPCSPTPRPVSSSSVSSVPRTSALDSSRFCNDLLELSSTHAGPGAGADLARAACRRMPKLQVLDRHDVK